MSVQLEETSAPVALCVSRFFSEIPVPEAVAVETQHCAYLQNEELRGFGRLASVVVSSDFAS